MLTEIGRIKEIRNNKAVVLVDRKSVCGDCHSRGMCSSLRGDRVYEVEADNPENGQPGDRVIVAMESSGVVGLAALVYGLPVAALIAGGALGSWIGGKYGGSGEISAIFFSLISFIGSLLFIRYKGRIMAAEKRYIPVITAVVRGNRCPEEEPAVRLSPSPASESKK